MSVVRVLALKRNRSGTAEWQRGHRTYTQAFMVITDDPADGSQVARTAIDPNNGPVIPQPGTFYVAGNDLDLGAFIKSVEAHEVGDSGLVWEVSVVADSEMPEPPQPYDNPLARPAEISWSFAQFQRVVDKDIAGLPIVNSAGQSFDPPIQIDQSRPVLNIERNEETYDPIVMSGFMDTVNEDIFFGFIPGQVKCSNISGRRQFENNQFYWRISYEFHININGWILEILDQGRYDVNGKPCTDANGNESTEPCLLTADGVQMAWPIDPTQANYRLFNVYESAPFSELALP